MDANSASNRKELTVDLWRVSMLIRQKWLPILLAAVLCAVAALAGSYHFGHTQYESAVMFYVDNGSDASVISSSDISASKSLAAHCIALLESEDTMRTVYGNAGTDGTNVVIAGETVNDTAIFRVTVTAPDARLAYQTATAVAEVLPEYAGSVLAGAAVVVVDMPDAQITAVMPDHLRFTAAGFLLGLFLSLGAVALWAVFDSTIRSEADITECCGCQVLATLPHTDAVGNQMPNVVAEGLRFLRAGLDTGSRGRIIGVCGASAGESGSTVAVNLAYLLAQPNRRVLFIECDLRNPWAAEKLPADKTPGLSNYLNGDVTMDQAIQRHVFLGKHLHVITGGPVPDEPGDAFCSDLFAEALDELRLEYDAVILDIPPVEYYSDGLTVSKLADDMLLVVHRNACTQKALSDTFRHLEGTGAQLLGAVMIR